MEYRRLGIGDCYGLAVFFFVAMEDQEVIDYSSDRMEGVDIWEVLGGKVFEDLVDFPMLGPEML